MCKYAMAEQGLEEVRKVLNSKLVELGTDWRDGLSWTAVLENLDKHLSAMKRGEDYDKSGLLNIAHVAQDALILAEYYKLYPQGDDRQIGMKAKPIISLDIDDVVLDFKGAFFKKFGIELTPYWDGSYQMGEKLEELKNDKEFWTNIPVLHRPSFEPDLYITSRSIPDEWTKECLEKAGLPCAPVYSIPWNESKVELLKKHGVTIHVDDKPNNYREATEAGVFCYLMDAPHNKFMNVGHRRIYDLNLELK